MSAHRTILAIVALAIVGSGAAAHPLALRFDSRGECQRAMAEVNNFDRFNVAGPIFGIENKGEGTVFFLEGFSCEYDSTSGMWRMADYRTDDSGIGRAWDD